MLTGVGLYTDPREGAFIAPPNPRARWDDLGYKRTEKNRFGAMTRAKWNGRRGFVFHDACWSLLEQALHPAPVPIARVFEVCNSIPTVMGGDRLNWDHDYGGLALKRDSLFPWEERFADRRQFPDPESEGPFDPALYCADPLAIGEVDAILTDGLREAPDERRNLPLTSSGRDPFGSLPVELCSAIAFNLPTSDALNARLASRSFWHLFDSQQFWLSRFRGSSDRSWLFEAQHTTNARDWRSLYRRTSHGRLGQGLRNRKRIWGLAQDLLPLVKLHLNGFLPELSSPWTVSPGESWQWVLAAGNTEEESFEFSQLEKGCRRFWRQQVAIPENLSQISISTARVGHSVYVAGITLATAAGEVLRLGYHGAATESSLSVSGLMGFNVATGLGGIHAIQCIDQSGTPSAWLGCPDDVPKTERLAIGTRVTALEVGFDVGTLFTPFVPWLMLHANLDLVGRGSEWSALP